MEQEETPEKFVQQLTFRHKLFGGCDEEEVLLQIRKLCDIYEKQMNILNDRLIQEEAHSSELEQQKHELEEQMQVVIQKKEDALQEAGFLRIQVEEARRSEAAYADKIVKLEQLMESIEVTKRDILQKVKGDAIQEAERLQKENRELSEHKDALTDELKNSVCAVDTELAQTQAALESLRQRVRKLSEPYAVERK